MTEETGSHDSLRRRGDAQKVYFGVPLNVGQETGCAPGYEGNRRRRPVDLSL